MKSLAALQVPVVSALPTASAALAGSVLRLSGDNHAYWCTGSAWIDISPPITVSATAPSSPSVNDLWVDIS